MMDPTTIAKDSLKPSRRCKWKASTTAARAMRRRHYPEGLDRNRQNRCVRRADREPPRGARMRLPRLRDLARAITRWLPLPPYRTQQVRWLRLVPAVMRLEFGAA